MRYNVKFITDRTVITTTVEADDEGEAHNQALETVGYDLDLNLVPVSYQIEYEELDTEWEQDLKNIMFAQQLGFQQMRKDNNA